MEQGVEIQVADGPLLEGRLRATESARGGLVVCHPHPLYGGDMENPVVARAVEVAWESGLATMRFNFRGVGRSTGIHDGGAGERGDADAAFRLLSSRLDGGRPLALAGYSFGASVVAALADRGLQVAALALIAPPLTMLDVPPPSRPGQHTLLVAGTQDPYCPVADLEAFARAVPGSRVVTVDGANHFFFGKLFPLGEALRAWVREWAPD